MTTMTTYDIKVILNDKTTYTDKSGPYFGSYLDYTQATRKALEIQRHPDVFTVDIDSTTEMG